MNNVLPLFDQVQLPPPPRPADPLVERRNAMDAAFEHSDERWREEYTAFILRWLARNGPGTAEQIRTEYEMTSLPQTRKSKRASGAIFVALRRSGKIRVLGKEQSKLYGNDLTKYELAINE